MDLPIAIVDIVSLLFVGLLIVIIVFIILQRNITRYKLRNVKEPHFQICKSIPKDLKRKIDFKHTKSSITKEPFELFTDAYKNQPSDQVKSFVTRIKVYDTAKYLENALFDCGYQRSLGVNFENFLKSLVDNENNNSSKSGSSSINNAKLPKSDLREFIYYYKWSLTDPKVFANDDLRKFNILMNRIIDQLSANFNNKNLKRHKIELDKNGDFNINLKTKSIISYISEQNERSPSTFDYLINIQENDENITTTDTATYKTKQKSNRLSFKNLLKFHKNNSNNNNSTKNTPILNDSDITTTENIQMDVQRQQIEQQNPNFIDDDNRQWSSLINDINDDENFDDDEDEEEEKPLFRKGNSQDKHHSGKFNQGFNKTLD